TARDYRHSRERRRERDKQAKRQGEEPVSDMHEPQPELPAIVPYREPVTLPSEQVILSAPMSFTGSTRRLWRYYHPLCQASHGWALAGYRALFGTLLILWWLAVAAWYSLLLLLGVVPLVVLVAFRITRRTQRHGTRNKLRHDEILTAL